MDQEHESERSAVLMSALVAAVHLAGDNAECTRLPEIRRLIQTMNLLTEAEVGRLSLGRLAESQLEVDRLLIAIPRVISESSGSVDVVRTSAEHLAALLLPGASGSSGHESPESVTPEIHPVLISLSADYGNDARRERRVGVAMSILGVVLIAGALAIAFTGLNRAGTMRPFDFTEFGAYGMVSIATALLAVAALRIGASHSLVASEAERIQRQVVGFEAYASSFPTGVRDVLRASMVQRLFPRLLADDDPLREPRWPEFQKLVNSSLSDDTTSPTAPSTTVESSKVTPCEES